MAGVPVIRDAVDTDLEGITVIYNDAVTHTTAIWNNTVVDRADRAAWLQQRRSAGYPVLVAFEEASGTVTGYATFGPWRHWDGYLHTVEHSLYVHPDYRGAGLGGRLLATLIERARDQDRHMMIAGIEAGNTASLRLHQRFGFRETGRLPEVGSKFGRWLDLVFMQRIVQGPGQGPDIANTS